MKRILCIILSVTMVMSVCSFGLNAFAAEGTTYYVSSSSGDDSNNGLSKETPFKSLLKISSMTFSAGDRIFLKCGDVFEGTFSAKGSGTEENPIVLSSYADGEMPLITNMNGESAAVLIFDVSNWKVKNLEITSPNSYALQIYFTYNSVKNITIENLKIHDVNNYGSVGYYSNSRCAVSLNGWAGTEGAHLENIYLKNCEIYDSGYGLSMSGNTENSKKEPYNKNIVVENCSFHDICDDGFIITRCDTAIVRNTSFIRCCTSVGKYATAPVWTWGVTNAVIENCEIAGTANTFDGMSIDFDDHTDHSTYQYIYSHDNNKFMWNCPYDSDDHYYNTVRYCLSVNDGKLNNCGLVSGTPEHYFSFYNNTIVGGGSYDFLRYDKSTIKNNIFALDVGSTVKYNPFYEQYVGSNCYYSTIKPILDMKSICANPQFAGTDYSDINSFKLKKASPLIGKGVQVEEDMGEHDFFGNPLTDTHNIGCYEGQGVDGDKTYKDFFQVVADVLKFLPSLLISEINNGINFLKNALATYYL